MRLQLFLAQHTSHLEDIPAATPMTNVKLDWDAQKWKAPIYLMEDRAFDGVAGLGAAAAGGTVGALALGPALNGVLAQSFGQLSRRFVTSLGTRLAFAQQGAVAGTMVQPMGGQVIGAAIGVADRRRGRLSEQRRQRGLQPRRVRERRMPRRSTPPSPPGKRRSTPISTRPSTNGSTTRGRASCSAPNSLTRCFLRRFKAVPRPGADFRGNSAFAAICLARAKSVRPTGMDDTVKGIARPATSRSLHEAVRKARVEEAVPARRDGRPCATARSRGSS